MANYGFAGYKSFANPGIIEFGGKPAAGWLYLRLK
jgi:hypothetical protein